MSTIHYLKCHSLYFEAVCNKSKTFEVRVNDRDFKINNIVVLMEVDVETNYFTGNAIEFNDRFYSTKLGNLFPCSFRVAGFCLLEKNACVLSISNLSPMFKLHLP